MKKYILRNFLPLIILFFIAILYFKTAAVSVQHGDSGELVTNALKLRVNHPSGYPLYNLLFHPWLKLASSHNTFEVASFVNIVISLIGLVLLIFASPSKYRIPLALFSGVIATSSHYWEYSLIPDVFILNCLFVVVFLTFYLHSLSNPQPTSQTKIYFSLLGFANHLTLVLSLPLLWPVLRKITVKRSILLIFVSAISVLAIYCCLFLFSPDQNGSWGNLSNAKDLIKHILRTDYGTFNLMKEKTDSNFNLTIEDFFSHLGLNFWSLLLLLFPGLIFLKSATIKISSYLPLVISFFLSTFLFFYLAQISPIGFNSVILPRFYLMPLLIIGVLVISFFSDLSFKFKNWLYILVGLNIFTNVYINYPKNNLRHNSVLADYVKDIFNHLPQNSILYIKGDSEAFSAYYLAEVEKIRPDIILLNDTIYYDWQVKKILHQHPQLFTSGTPDDSGMLSKINFEKYHFFSNSLKLRNIENYAIDYFTLYYQIKPGQGIHFNCYNYYTNHQQLDSLREYNYYTVIKNSYSNCFLYQGLDDLHQNNYRKALVAFGQALNVSSFNLLALERKCFTLKLLNDSQQTLCYQELESLFDQIHPGNYMNEKMLNKTEKP